jgi:hypothetical protein
MDNAFIRKGHGYPVTATLNAHLEPCTAFDGFTVIAAPMGEFSKADREGRCGGPFRCDYQSHAIKLATDERGSGLYILMHNGSGREVLKVPEFYDRGELKAQILAMPEPVQYGLLYMIWNTASNARSEAQSQTAHKWAEAHQDGRIRKRRRAGRVSVYVETPFERDLRTSKTNPSRISINTATGEASPA